MLSGDTQARPLIRSFYDHAEVSLTVILLSHKLLDLFVSLTLYENNLQPINDLDFHPRSTILVSSAKDNCIKYLLIIYAPYLNVITRNCVFTSFFVSLVGSSTSLKQQLNERLKFFR